MGPFTDLALLSAFWDLLDRTLMLFYARCRGKPDPVLVPARDCHVVDGAGDDEMSDGDDTPMVAPPTLSDGSVDWGAWNKSQQRSVERFRKSRPAGPLMVVIIAAKGLPYLNN